MSDQKNWVVTFSADKPPAELRKELVDAGFHISQLLAEIGVVIGEASREKAEKVRKIEGVVDVELESPIELGDPDSPQTW